MRTLKIEIQGKTDNDLEIALYEVRRLVGQGYTSGNNSNDDGGYSFTVEGEEEEEAATA